YILMIFILFFFFFKQKTAYEIGLGIPAEPLFRSKRISTMNKMWLNMLGTFVKDWFRYESHFVHGRDSLVDILKERGLLSESDARSEERRVGKECSLVWLVCGVGKRVGRG